jgi:hypothetical protein
MTRQAVSEGPDIGCRAEEEIPSQTKARNPEIMRCDGVCRHRGISWCCN